jgi:hypothetical protein
LAKFTHRKEREAAKLAVDAAHRPIFYLRRGSLANARPAGAANTGIIQMDDAG